MSSLLPNLLHFSRLLGDLGLDVPAVRTLDIVQALDRIDLGRKRDFYYTLRCLLVHRPQDLAPFDTAFHVFWRPPPGERTTRDLRAMGEQRRTGAPQVEAPTATPPPEDSESNAPPPRMDQVAALSYSDREVLQQKDFAQLTEEELREARRMMSELRWDVGSRRTRRWHSGRGQTLDIRRVIRGGIRYGGEMVDLPTRRRTRRRRPLVVLCDVSGSMERYSRMLLHFLYCMTGRLDRVEVFVFATRLTRVTRYLRSGAGHSAATDLVPRLPRQVPDFAGGTRIGEVLGAFNRHWARRVLGHGAVVLMISDGWDRGEPDLLAREMARLHRSSHRLIWLNPLLGSDNYEPLTRGLQAALPHIDDFLTVHNLDSLEALGRHLSALPAKNLYSSHQCSCPRPTPSVRLARPSGIA